MHKKLRKTASASEWDVIKGTGALGLPFVHTVETFLLCGLVGTESQAFCSAVMALTVFGPSVFMICMGMRNAGMQDPKALFRYGRILLSVGFLLNLLRSILPWILVAVVAGSTADHLASFLFMSDIYLFAGLFYMLLGLLRRFRVSTAGIAAASVVMLVLNGLLGGHLKTGSETWNAIMGNLVYIDDGSVFPLLSWTIFPVFGMLAEKVLSGKSPEEADGICRKAWMISAAVFTVSVLGLRLAGRDAFTIAVSPLNEYKTGFFNVVLVLSLNLIVIIPLRFLMRVVRVERLTEFFRWISANLMVFYFVHWCLLTLVCYVSAAVLYTAERTAGIGFMLAVAILVDAATVFIIRKWGFVIMKRILKVVRA